MADLSDTDPSRASAQAFAELAKVHLAPTAPVLTPGLFNAPSDFDLNPDAIAEAQGQIDGRPAAVLVPVIAHPTPTLLFTQRPQHLTVHSGQISFPGGKHDANDASLEATALREASEEIGLERRDVEVLGFLDGYQTATGYLIAPVVALVRPTFVATPNPEEVSEVFEVPLSFLMNPGNHQIRTKEYRRKTRQFYVMPYQDRYIWGATAGILRNLYIRLFGS